MHTTQFLGALGCIWTRGTNETILTGLWDRPKGSFLGIASNTSTSCFQTLSPVVVISVDGCMYPAFTGPSYKLRLSVCMIKQCVLCSITVSGDASRIASTSEGGSMCGVSCPELFTTFWSAFRDVPCGLRSSRCSPWA